MPFGIVGRTSPRMRQVAGLAIGSREGVLLGVNLGRTIVTNGDFTAYVCHSAATRPSSQITSSDDLRKILCGGKRMAKVKMAKNIAESFNPLSRAHECFRRQTGLR